MSDEKSLATSSCLFIQSFLSCKPCPEILHQAFFVYMCRLLGIAAWGWVLMGLLMWAGLKNGLTLGAAIAGAVSLGILGVCLYAWKKARRVRKDSLLALEKIRLPD